VVAGHVLDTSRIIVLNMLVCWPESINIRNIYLSPTFPTVLLCSNAATVKCKDTPGSLASCQQLAYPHGAARPASGSIAAHARQKFYPGDDWWKRG
jgi:hypothetical protein